MDNIFDIRNIFHRSQYKIIYSRDDDYIFYDDDSDALFIDVNELSVFLQLYNQYELNQYKLFRIKQKEIVLFLQHQDNRHMMMECYLAVYDTQQKILLNYPSNVDIHLLDMTYIDFVCEHYRTIQNRSYIQDRIENECLWGLFVAGKCVGFIGVHDEGSMGMLQVLPEYQRHGYAYLLEGFLINEMISRECIPYCEVEIDNTASLSLQLKLGLKISHCTYYWME